MYILGGNNTIHHNVFENARSYQDSVLTYAPNFYYYMPDNYYSYAQGSMIYIRYTAANFELPFNDTIKKAVYSNTIRAEFFANKMRNNTHM